MKKIYMIGIGGIGMSGLARLYKHEGIDVSGSDRTISPITCGLEALGITVAHEHTAENISPDIELIVYSDAVKEDNPERVRARELGIPEMQYFEALAEVANKYHLIAVSGTHGKTTTAAMIVDILEDAGLDPTAIVGSLRSKTGSNFRPGKSKYFVVEADEYRRHFLHLQPDVLVITNVEFDHPDYFKDIDDVENAFREMVLNMHPESRLICDTTDTRLKKITHAYRGRGVISYHVALNWLIQKKFKIKQPGLHNLKNAAAAVTAVDYMERNYPTPGYYDKYAVSIQNFEGTWRRFQHKGECNGAPVIDDYAHHPTEIAATISGARELYPDKKIIAVFQPHTYTRTNKLLGDFALELAKADRVLLAPIYAAREENESGVTSEQLAEKIKETNEHVENFESFNEIITGLKKIANEKDVILVMGAGDITAVANQLAGS